MLHISVDNDSVWAIKTNGDVFVRTGVSSYTPRGTRWIKIKASSDLVQITSLSGLVWALDIYNHVQIFQGKIYGHFFVIAIVTFFKTIAIIAFDGVVLSCHIRGLEEIYTLCSCLNVKELLARNR